MQNFVILRSKDKYSIFLQRMGYQVITLNNPDLVKILRKATEIFIEAELIYENETHSGYHLIKSFIENREYRIKAKIGMISRVGEKRGYSTKIQFLQRLLPIYKLPSDIRTWRRHLRLHNRKQDFEYVERRYKKEFQQLSGYRLWMKKLSSFF